MSKEELDSSGAGEMGVNIPHLDEFNINEFRESIGLTPEQFGEIFDIPEEQLKSMQEMFQIRQNLF